jgi:hypothetical protein
MADRLRQALPSLVLADCGGGRHRLRRRAVLRLLDYVRTDRVSNDGPEVTGSGQARPSDRGDLAGLLPVAGWSVPA